ncbi:hypothetical protein [Nonomuraea sp. NPDC049400]|uniref:hypothetical protein n=1 Tax=Nonomuraea sp. NPDC049400 TaxID=3364352 RepID=UPI0037B6C6BA
MKRDRSRSAAAMAGTPSSATPPAMYSQGAPAATVRERPAASLVHKRTRAAAGNGSSQSVREGLNDPG